MTEADKLASTDGHRDLPIALDTRSREMFALAERVARADVTVMLTGESGVGKEVYARFIHAASNRKTGPFIAVNCAAIPESMLEAMLFGHDKGAFTGAGDARAGKFEQASGGTLLLDEITEMPVSLQAKLLRALQEREVERLGSARARRVDVRVIATSNRQLSDAVREGALREDLYYRLNVFPLKIPALRDRPGDIIALAEHLLQRHCADNPVPILSAAACDYLRQHAWPGNVRELENVMQRALILHGGGRIEPADLRIDTGEARQLARSGDDGESLDLEASLRVSEGELIRAALRAEEGRRKPAADRLGISPRTLRYKMARLRDMGVALP